jgi:glutaminyl-tRNA synthetase
MWHPPHALHTPETTELPMPTADTQPTEPAATDFIRQIVADDLKQGRHRAIATRFPPEPNGYLHIGHAKSIVLNFNLARETAGRCHLRFDDTNPTKEEQHYIDAIKKDVRWLGFDWGEHEYYASDYFDRLYEWACLLIKAGKAYVDDQSADQVRESRGTLTQPGTESPCRARSAEENLDLFQRMAKGDFADGQAVLRAKIDMAAPNLNLRDPVMYRVLHAAHPRTGDTWCIYPMYDWAHGQSDWIEGITHSLCSLEFEDHRPLYDWFIDALKEVGATSPAQYAADDPANTRPRQTEFARLNLSYTVMSKRKLLALVKEGYVDAWDDPRMPTLSGMRRRGYPPQAIRQFCEEIGVSKRDQQIELPRLEHNVREALNAKALRRMGVLDPLKVVVTNYPEGEVEYMDAVNNPEDEAAGKRQVPFTRELYIERNDFMEDPPRKFKRLSPGAEVRLRYGYFITCQEAIKDEAGNIVELHCTYDPETKGGNNPSDGRKPKGTIHWVSAEHGVDAEVRLYDHLFTQPDPDDVDESQTFRDAINPDSCIVQKGAKVEPVAAETEPGVAIQFERQGYFCPDVHESTADHLVFNRTVSLKDTWAKMQQKGKAG